MKKTILTIILFILAVVGVFALQSAVAMWLWNTVIADGLSGIPITFKIACAYMFIIDIAVGLFD
jgi:hypothetical protein